MRWFILMVCVLTTSLSATYVGVIEESYYTQDAQMVYDLIKGMGYPSCRVAILYTTPTQIDFYVNFDPLRAYGNYEAWFVALVAVGAVSTETSWSSYNLHVGFADKMLTTRTSCARYITNNFNTRTESQWLEYLDSNTRIQVY